MINFDSLSLKAFVDEYGSILESGRIQRIQQPTRREIILNIRAHRANHKFYININPKYPHLCILSAEGEALRDIKVPKQPPMFCMLLRKHLEGARILQVRQPEHERILELYFESYNEFGEKTPLVLAIEMMGKHSNVILYNCETQVIVGCAHNIGEEKSRDRELAGGLTYIYPPQKEKQNLLRTSFEDFVGDLSIISKPFANALNEKYFDVSVPLAKELLAASNIELDNVGLKTFSKEELRHLFELLQQSLSLELLRPCISEDKSVYSLFGVDSAKVWQEHDSVNEVMDKYFGSFILEDKLSSAKATLSSAIVKELKKISKNILQNKKSIAEEQKAEKYRQWADILSSNAHLITMPNSLVRLEDFYAQNEIVEIELDEELSLKDNIQRYYKLYNKLKKAVEISSKMLEGLENKKLYLEGVKLSIEQAENLDVLDEIRQELQAEGLVKQSPSRKKVERAKVELDEYDVDGYKIYVGRNNRQNDYIVSKLSRSEDIWLHTWEIPGSHVLIKLSPEKKDVPDNVLLEAAKLAVHFSQARGSAKVTVVKVRRKFLKKPPGAPLGYVTYTNEEAIIVDNTHS